MELDPLMSVISGCTVSCRCNFERGCEGQGRNHDNGPERALLSVPTWRLQLSPTAMPTARGCRKLAGKEPHILMSNNKIPNSFLLRFVAGDSVAVTGSVLKRRVALSGRFSSGSRGGESFTRFLALYEGSCRAEWHRHRFVTFPPPFVFLGFDITKP